MGLWIRHSCHISTGVENMYWRFNHQTWLNQACSKPLQYIAGKWLREKNGSWTLGYFFWNPYKLYTWELGLLGCFILLRHWHAFSTSRHQRWAWHRPVQTSLFASQQGRERHEPHDARPFEASWGWPNIDDLMQNWCFYSDPKITHVGMIHIHIP